MYMSLSWRLLNSFCYLELTHSAYLLLDVIQHSDGLWALFPNASPSLRDRSRDRAHAQAPREPDSSSTWDKRAQ